MARAQDAGATADRLVELTLSRTASDNVTSVVTYVTE